MGDIDRNATSVNVWLGNEGQGSQHLFGFLHLVQSEIASFLKAKSINFKEFLNKQYFLRSIFEAEAVRHQVSGLLDLLNRRYWTRIWIVQEFILAQNLTIYCGWDSIDWETFLACLKWVFWGGLRGGGGWLFSPALGIGISA